MEHESRSRSSRLQFFSSDGINESFPANSAPVEMGLEQFRDEFALTNRKRLLIGRLEHALNEIRSVCEVHAVLIGGSILNGSPKDRPRDLDALIMYSQNANSDSMSLASILQHARASWLRQDLDLRFVPIDGGVVLFAKVLAFFSVLYSIDRENASNRLGSVLIDLDRGCDA